MAFGALLWLLAEAQYVGTGPVPDCGGDSGVDCGSCSDYSSGGITVAYGGQCDPKRANKGFPNVDMDEIGTSDDDGFTTIQKISIVFATKQEHTDSDRVVHGATSTYDASATSHASYDVEHGVPFTYEKANGRYTLPCKQAEGKKTIKITVRRPAALTAFGGEWVKAYEKDSWKNITNEYEPFTFNDYGTKIPLQEFRETTVDDDDRTIVDDAPDAPEMNVFMVMDKDGDFEVRYANPSLTTSTGKWIAFEFKKHQLRVGSPWSTCTRGAATASTNAYTGIGTIIPVYLGNPALLIADYKRVKTTLEGAYTGNAANVPTKIILPIFTPENDGADKTDKTWTEGWVEGGDGTGRNPLTTKKQAYKCDSSWVEGDAVDNNDACVLTDYTTCYSGGSACPLDHSVCKVEYCELQRWREIVDLYQGMSNVEVLGLIETKDLNGNKRTDADIEADIDAYTTHVTGVKGFYFNNAHGDTATVNGLMAIAHSKSLDSKFTVFGLGEPLLDKTALDKDGTPDVWVTLNTGKSNAGDRLGGDLGSWTPFSWYPDTAATKWSSIVTEVGSTELAPTLSMMFDRGYGYVYLHSDEFFNTTSSTLDDLITAIGGTSRRLEATERQLQTLDDGVSTTRYECDDTLFACEPVCVETVGLVRNKVSDSQCSEAQKPEACSCRCYHHTQWTCEGDKVVCKASLRDGGLETVGDLVCETRGTPKPTWDASPERMAAECTVLATLRDDKPTEQCMEKYREEKLAAQTEAETETVVTPELNVEPADLGQFLIDSGAVPTAIAAALALYL